MYSQAAGQMRIGYPRHTTITLLILCPYYCQAALPCATCHPKETEGYLASFMGRSMGTPESVAAGKVNDPQSDTSIRIEWRNAKMFHILSEDGLTAAHEISYRIGAGKVGYSYATRIGSFLVESPASYFKKYGWDISPGFAGREMLDFNRVLTNRCLFCHSDARGSNERDLAAIGCERCHGNSSEHLKNPSSRNIINPANLPVRARDSVCEQCHLEGVARVLNPGKVLDDFKPGMNLEQTVVIFVETQTSPGVRAVSQEEQLAASKCNSLSGGKLWCGTCHHPHRQSPNRNDEIKAVCTSCHPRLSAASHSAVSECTSCHMPQRAPTDVAHAALTDHRILARPNTREPPTLSAPQEIVAWREPPAEFQKRDLGLAYLESAAIFSNQHFEGLGGNLLKDLAVAQQNEDAPVLAALGNFNLSQGHPAEAVAFFRQACDIAPLSGSFAMLLGISLKQSADTEAAINELRRAIRLDPSQERSYFELSALYAKDGRLSDAKDILSEYLKWNPQSVLGRLTRDTLNGSKKGRTNQGSSAPRLYE